MVIIMGRYIHTFYSGNTDILCTEDNSKEKSFASELFYFLRENTSIFRLTDLINPRPVT